jgi:flagellar motor protein MotB
MRPYVDFLVYWAATLARQGECESAQELLMTVPDAMATDQVFDLRARIQAQQGEYSNAEAQWRRAIQLDPSNGKYQKCLYEAERGRLRLALFRLRSVMGIGLMLAAVLGSFSLWQGRRGRTQVNMASSQAPIVLPPQINGNPTEFSFSGPLFSSGTKLTRSGRNHIRQIGNQLRAASRIEILGHTDSRQLKPNSKYRDNQELGLARAYAVALLLHKEFGISLTHMTLAPGKPPDEINRMAVSPDHRTAVIRVWNGGK